MSAPEVRVLTLTQPWATLIACGAKTIETRSWSTPYRGRIAIHAAKGYRRPMLDLVHREPFRTDLLAAGYEVFRDLPRAAIVATATLIGVEQLPVDGPWSDPLVERLVDGNGGPTAEYSYGDYSPLRYGWLLDDVERLAEPIPARGQLGLRPASADVAEQLGKAAIA